MGTGVTIGPINEAEGPTLTVSGGNLGESYVPGSTNNPSLHLHMSTDLETLTLNSVTFTFQYNYSKLDYVKLWVDADHSHTVTGGDTQIGGNQTPASTVTFSDLNKTITNDETYLLLTIDVSSLATGVDHFIVTLQSSGNVDISGGDKSSANYPIGGADHTLPVELSAFTALPDYGKIVLKWRTESEVNNLGFDIYRALSLDGIFKKITESLIKGAGSSTSVLNYKYVDDNVAAGVMYFYKLESIDYDGTKHLSDIIASAQVLTAPKVFAVSQNFPNPFNAETRITYTLPYATSVRLTIYNNNGQLVRTLVGGPESVGMHSVVWNGKTDSGTPVSSGIYFYRFSTTKYSQIRRMVFLR